MFNHRKMHSQQLSMLLLAIESNKRPPITNHYPCHADQGDKSAFIYDQGYERMPNPDHI